jgi:hypothetical protein
MPKRPAAANMKGRWQGRDLVIMSDLPITISRSSRRAKAAFRASVEGAGIHVPPPAAVIRVKAAVS